MPTKRFNERQKQRCMAVWIGGIFLKDEGGYEIVLRSLAHYKKRLRTISESPELKEAAAMFAPILVSQAQKRYPMVIEAQKKIEQVLQNSISAQSLEQDLKVQLFERHARGLSLTENGEYTSNNQLNPFVVWRRENEENIVIPSGTPLFQIIPYKRDLI